MDESKLAQTLRDLADKIDGDKQRDVSLQSLMQQVHQKVDARDNPETGDMWFVQDLYYDRIGQPYVVVINQGRLHRARVNIDPQTEEVSLGMFEPVQVNFEPMQRTLIERQADGRYHGFAVLCTAAVNKDGEIDSTSLFDTFVERFKGDGTEHVNVYHLAGAASRIGQIDYLFRQENLLVGHLVFDDDPVSQRAAETLAADADSEWGGSIEFRSDDEGNLMEVAPDIWLNVYTAGTLRGYSVTRAAHGSAWFTGNFIKERQMNDAIKNEVLALLGGDEAMLATLEERLKDGNDRLAEAITRMAAEFEADDPDAEPAADTPPVEEPVAEEASPEPEATDEEPEQESTTEMEDLHAQVNGMSERLDSVASLAEAPIELDDDAVGALAAQVQEHVGAAIESIKSEFEAIVNGLKVTMESQTSELAELRSRLKSVDELAKRSADDIVNQHDENRPVQPTRVLTYRGSQSGPSVEEKPVTISALADKEIENLDAW